VTLNSLGVQSKTKENKKLQKTRISIKFDNVQRFEGIFGILMKTHFFRLFVFKNKQNNKQNKNSC